MSFARDPQHTKPSSLQPQASLEHTHLKKLYTHLRNHTTGIRRSIKMARIRKIFSIILVALTFLVTTPSAWSMSVYNTTICGDFFDEASGEDITVSYFAYSDLYTQVSTSACFALGRHET
ncbi:hypothetical protein AC579_725 [Pseudocercospora musae]|uniref:Uncharacterized protein n=1 Tax=Pseudocercospora musae TaxID=113226 RepID=A0A139I9K7_9PEZI|nr:hypothetical protein AC579_725 [Pseudocercospora musae]KXT11377.1 hypothetical protein AC579_725 [Pseudocercospora musae]